MALSRPAPSAAARSWPQRLRRRLRAYNWRPLAGMAGGSLVFSLALVGYLFGVDSSFLARLFAAFLVVFWLLAFTFLAAVPFVSWAAASWFGRGWSEVPPPVPRARRQNPDPSPAPVRRANVPARPAAPGSYS